MDATTVGGGPRWMTSLGRAPARYGLVPILVLTSLLLWKSLSAGEPLPVYITFYPSVMVAALLLGFYPGLLATFLAAATAAYWILPPAGRWKVERTSDLVGLALFSGMGVLMSAVAGLYRRARRQVTRFERERAQREGEEQLRRREDGALRRYQLVAANSRDIILFIRRDDGRILEANAAASLAYGYSREELLALTVQDLRAPGTRPSVPFQMSSADDQGLLFETKHRRRDGSAFHVEVSSQGSTIDGTRMLVSFVRDITERHRGEAALRESEQRFAAIHDHAPFGIALTRMPEGTTITVNDAFLKLFEYTRDEVVGKTSVDLGISDAASRALVAARLREGGSVRDLEVTRTTRSGGRCVLLLSLDWVAVGEERLVLTTLQDITARRDAEDALRASERLYRAIGESIDFGVWVCAPDGRNTYASPSFLKLVGLTQEQCSSYGWGEVLHPDDAERTLAAWKECVRTGGSWDIEHRFRGVDGRWHPVLARGAAVRNEQGEILCWAGINLDIGRLKEAENELREADGRKSEFLAVLSHELRNPLAPILNSIHLLERTPAESDAARRARDVLHRQTDHLTRLVDDLLDITRITHGKIELQLARLDAREVVRRSCDDARGQFEQHGVELTCSEGTDPAWVDADEPRLAQIVGNLLSNAAKFTPPGGQVRVEVRGSDDACQVSVRDTGMGVDPDDLERIFEPFVQSRQTRRHTHGGLGIGLALVRQLVHQHGGTVRATSAGRGQGSEFVVTLPAAALPAVAPAVDAVPGGGGLSVLVVEDNEDAGTSLADLLELDGHHVTVVATGRAGVEAVSAHRPDVLICDVGLPDLDGHEVIRAVRAAGSRVFAIALTGYALPENREQALAAGYDAHLPKPPPLGELKELLARALRARR